MSSTFTPDEAHAAREAAWERRKTAVIDRDSWAQVMADNLVAGTSTEYALMRYQASRAAALEADADWREAGVRSGYEDVAR